MHCFYLCKPLLFIPLDISSHTTWDSCVLSHILCKRQVSILLTKRHWDLVKTLRWPQGVAFTWGQAFISAVPAASVVWNLRRQSSGWSCNRRPGDLVARMVMPSLVDTQSLGTLKIIGFSWSMHDRMKLKICGGEVCPCFHCFFLEES